MSLNHRFCVAPMMDWTDRHDRFFLRQLSRHALLYTEMVTADAVIHGDREHLIGFNDCEHPLALQLGGADPAKMAAAARIGQEFGYDEVNINVGCPSDRVQSGRFGACLMAEPEIVSACVKSMIENIDIPVTVKCRIGIDDRDDYQYLRSFIEKVAAAGCQTFIIHARVAVLQGLSPKQNRDVPPLNYERAHQIKGEFPQLEIVLNGGLDDHDVALEHLSNGLDGVMFGREAYHNPYSLAAVDGLYFQDDQEIASRHQIARKMLPYIDAHCDRGGRLNAITRHLHGLFLGQPGAKAWRRFLSENSYQPGRGAEVVEQALAMVPDVDTPFSAAG